MSKEIAEEYASSLADLTVNSKPLINMLTILAEENIAHAGTIVQVVDKHLEKVRPEWKLPVLYLVDSIIKNVGHDYKLKFAQVIINMFTKTFKQVDEKTRSQMFKLRETWHDVLPAAKLYQLDVKVNLIDPAWPIQAQPPSQSNIHFNPNFLKKPGPNAAVVVPEVDREEAMRNALALKEQELLLLQKKKIEIELENTKRELEEKMLRMGVAPPAPNISGAQEINANSVPVAMPISPAVQSLGGNVVAPLENSTHGMDNGTVSGVPVSSLPIKQRLGPPVMNKMSTVPGPRIPPVSMVMLATSKRQDPRLAKRNAAMATAQQKESPPPKSLPIENLFESKPIERRKNAITINTDVPEKRDPRQRRDPRLNKKKDLEEKREKRRYNNESSKKEKTKDKSFRKKKKTAENERSKNEEPVRVSIESTLKNEVKEVKQPKESAASEDVKPISPKVKTSKSPTKLPVISAETRKVKLPPIPKIKSKPISELADVVVANKDVDLRLLPNPIASEPATAINRKRPSIETEDNAIPNKKNKTEKFDVLFGEEDVDLRTLPVQEAAPPPPVISLQEDEVMKSPTSNPANWTNLKEPNPSASLPEANNKTKLEEVRAKLAEATKGKDRLGRPLLFGDEVNERRRTISSEDTDMRDCVNLDRDKETIKTILNQAEEQLKTGDMNKDQYNKLVMQVLQLNERQKLNEAKQRESLEASKRKLQRLARKEPLSSDDDASKSPKESFGDIDERVVPISLSSPGQGMDCDLRVPPLQPPCLPNIPNMLPPQMEFNPNFDNRNSNFGPHFRQTNPRMMQPSFGNFRQSWRPMNGPVRPSRGFPQFPVRGGFEPRGRMPRPQIIENPPIIGSEILESPFEPYERVTTPPLLGGPESKYIPPTDFRHLDYIRNDTVKTIEIDGISREIRFYDDVAIIMMAWDDPRVIRFLPTKRKITFNNSDSYILSTNDSYKTVEVDGVDMVVKFGFPTRELYVNHRWYECYFGGKPFRILVDDKIYLVHMDGPPPKVDVSQEKRCDLVAGKINLIVDATSMFPLFLDAKPQIFEIGGAPLTIRFVDSLETVLINEKPFSVEFGGLPKPIYLGKNKHFIRFSVLPSHVKPGRILIKDMEGRTPQILPKSIADTMEDPFIVLNTEENVTSSENVDSENGLGGLDLLASAMPTTPSVVSLHGGYSASSDTIPGLENSPVKKMEPDLANVNINDLYSKLVALGIVKSAAAVDNGADKVEQKIEKKEEEDKSRIKQVDLLKPDTLKQRQPGVVAKLYGGMQCSGCGVRFPPEHTVRYSQHLDWHFRQNRRERDSARKAHSRNWHYDLSDWVQYEEIEDLEEREKSWFENQASETNLASASAAVEEADPSVPASDAPEDHRCALCGDRFHQYYDHEREEWHLRGAVRRNNANYHPGCLQDNQESTSEEVKLDETNESSAVIKELPEEKMEADEVEKELETDRKEPEDDSDSDVELLEPPKEEPELVQDEEIEKTPEEENEKIEETNLIEEDEDDDDVVLKTEPVEEILVDDGDTDDETEELRKVRDAKVPIRPENIKKEKIDPDDEPVVTAEEEAMKTSTQTSQETATASIDGNVQLPAPILQIGAPSIRINIAKQTPLVAAQPTTPPPASEEEEQLMEAEPEFTFKETMKDVEFVRRPPVKAGNELSGLCSIM